MSKLHSHEVWIKLPDGPEFVAGKAWTLEQQQDTINALKERVAELLIGKRKIDFLILLSGS